MHDGDNNKFKHDSVLFAEAIEELQLSEGSVAVDCTAGGGGHLRAMADAVGKTGTVLAFDRDLRAHKNDAAGKLKNKTQVELIHDSFSTAKENLESRNLLGKVRGLLCDLGTSSHHFDEAERGFSFNNDGPLDMRMDQTCGQTAYELIQTSRESDLADIIYQYGDERRSRRIAKSIKEQKEFPDSTKALAQLIIRAYPKGYHKTHPATRTFQALRVAVNNELLELETLLKDIPSILASGGRAAIISFQSQEDRLVKHFFRNLAKEDPRFSIVTKKPIRPESTEVKNNPRARSAKMRVLEKV